MTFTALARRALPGWAWTRLRLWRLRRGVRRFQPRVVHHTYGGHRLAIHLADPLARGWYDADWPLPPELSLLGRHGLVDGATVFDLGAHQGVVALMMARMVGDRGRVVAVEPSAHNVGVLRRNLDLNGARNVAVVEAAVADRAGTLGFNLGINGQADDGRGGWGRVEVSATTVDELTDQFGPPGVLFLDVEGYECHALRGAARTLATRPDCCVEVHAGIGLERFGGSAAEVLGYFPDDAYERWVAPEAEPVFRRLSAGECPPEGRFFLVATALDGHGDDARPPPRPSPGVPGEGA